MMSEHEKLSPADQSSDLGPLPRVTPLVFRNSSPLRTVATLASGDVLSAVLAQTLAALLWSFINPSVHTPAALSLLFLAASFVGMNALVRLYPGVLLHPAVELRRIAVSSTAIYMLVAVSSFLTKEHQSRGVFLVAWALTFTLTPLMRTGLRAAFAREKWWGYPVLILGAGTTGTAVTRALTKNPWLGLKPIAVLDDDADREGSLYGIPVLQGIELAPTFAQEMQVPFAILAIPGGGNDLLHRIIHEYGDSFPHMLVIPDMFGFSSLWVEARDLQGTLGLEVKQRLLLRVPALFKRAFDLTLTVLGGLVISPLLLAIYILIKRDSPGPAFFGHTRLGRDGREFKAWKFRSMVIDADKALQSYLDSDPEAREEWERDQKLRDDPRVTRIGAFLRKTSLDELPQLYNVLVGQMSLVGPRPIVSSEVERYGDSYVLYKKVRPGISGLWQVSGRNNTTYAERVTFDTYYVRNWSVWLDLYILAKTFLVVAFRHGAY